MAVAAPAVALDVGGDDYTFRVDGQRLALDSSESAPGSPVQAAAGAETGPVEVSGDSPACRVESADVRASTCDAGAPAIAYEAPAVEYDVDVTLPFAAAPSSTVEDPSMRELVAYSDPFEVSVPQLAAAAAASAAATGLAYLVWRALKTGGILAFLPLATHLKPSELLDDPHRKAIYDLIQGEPGVSTKDIADRLGLAWGTVTHHLLKLEKARFVVSQKFGKYRRYFVNGSGIEAKEQVAILRVARTGDVVEFVRQNPGASQKDVSAGMGVSSSTVLWHVKRLIRVGVLDKVRDGKSVRYYVRETAIETRRTGPMPFSVA
ncbi:MAG TPA: winged helix-turn-helix transcriptional regulator [Candidatus Thermoplasmatota archaeon]|nr:winged helix-turn-helix transcriptional regulator [Candidatus Thermoplasmatota archaeon]